MHRHANTNASQFLFISTAHAHGVKFSCNYNCKVFLQARCAAAVVALVYIDVLASTLIDGFGNSVLHSEFDTHQSQLVLFYYKLCYW
jgi:hypothetical protein